MFDGDWYFFLFDVNQFNFYLLLFQYNSVVFNFENYPYRFLI
jgi:hypothetical protein